MSVISEGLSIVVIILLCWVIYERTRVRVHE